MNQRRFVFPIMMLLLLLLNACGSRPAAVPPTSFPATSAPPLTSVPPTQLPPTVLPTAVPTATPLPPTLTPAPESALPAALVYKDADGRLVVLESDGVTTRVLAEEPGGIGEWQLAPDGRALVYLAEVESGIEVVRRELPGGERTRLFLAEAQIPSVPRWSADGAQIALRIETGDSSGVFVLPASGGDPRLLVSDGAAPDAPDLAFAPLRWSPDGTYLLLSTFIPEADYCGQAVFDLQAEAVVVLVPPDGTLTNCDFAVWNVDSTRIVLNLQDAGAYADMLPGLWVADPQNGAISAWLPRESEGAFQRFTALFVREDTLYMLRAETASDAPREPDDPPLEFTLVRTPLDDAPLIETLRTERWPITRAVWAPQADGVLIGLARLAGDAFVWEWFWVPLDNRPPLLLPALTTGEVGWINQ